MRLEMNRKTFLAIEAMWALEDAGERVQGAPLADTIGTSTAFIAQIMNPLVREGWVESTPGPGGGYTLGAELDDISLLEFVEALEGPIDDRCALRGGECSQIDSCAVHEAWQKARLLLIAELGTQTLTSIPRSEARV